MKDSAAIVLQQVKSGCHAVVQATTPLNERRVEWATSPHSGRNLVLHHYQEPAPRAQDGSHMA